MKKGFSDSDSDHGDDSDDKALETLPKSLDPKSPEILFYPSPTSKTGLRIPWIWEQ